MGGLNSPRFQRTIRRTADVSGASKTMKGKICSTTGYDRSNLAAGVAELADAQDLKTAREIRAMLGGEGRARFFRSFRR
jgi:hypothetical protein